MRAILSLLLAVLLMAIPAWGMAAERLIVFVDGDGSALQERFRTEQLPQFKALSDELGVQLEIFDVAERGKAPDDVRLTPLIAFQNWRGTSIYQGRYATLDRVRNFVRTSRFMPQGDEPFVREQVPVWERGGMKVAVPIKVTEASGPGAEALPVFDEAAIAEVVASGMGAYALADSVSLGRSDRSWYADFHPFVAEDGTLYLSSELYSQFHCHEPVRSWLDEPIGGPAEEWASVFRAAAARLEAELVQQMNASEIGDGFDVIDRATVAGVSWDEAGLALPERPAGDAGLVADIELPRDWTVDADAQDIAPAVQFTWPPPVDAYSGEATKITGSIQLGGDKEAGWTFAGLSGSFTAEAKSVTMGESDLDAFIHSGILEAGEHPEPTFTIESVDVEPAFASKPVRLGELVPVTLSGTYAMLGQSIPLTVPMSAEAFIDEDGRPRLSLTGQWQLPLAGPWEIEGPPGPKEASSVMVFACRIVLEPSED
ncbi:MAG: YceI family protein [Planctomycetota bacterium]